MGLLEGETWDDYEGKEVFVTSETGKEGFRGDYVGYVEDAKQVQVHNPKNNKTYDIDEKMVYGLWMLEDW
jgi:hypothetical protein